MWLSENWLREWIHPYVNIKSIYEKITKSGLEVEEINNMLVNCNNLVIGKIVSFLNHPKSNFLRIIKVKISSKKTINIVSRINNFKPNLKVIVATLGSILPDGKVIKLVKIKGVLSEGIICSFSNLNMFGEKEKIIQLPHDAPVGLDLKEYDFYNDRIIKISIPPNRMDALGIFGISRDVSVLNNLPLPKLKSKIIPITIKEKCVLKNKVFGLPYNFRGRLIKNINLHAKTPYWMKEKLRRCCINSKNIVVDIYNYVFLEFGQSLYMFSFSNIIENIVLNFVKFSEKLIFSNKKKIIFNHKVMLISTKNYILSFLGNINFDLFPVDLNNNFFFIGSFFIDPELLFLSNYNIKVNNSDLIFSDYNIDSGLQSKIVDYATHLFLSICGGQAGPISKYHSKEFSNCIKKIRLYKININKLLGSSISSSEIYKILSCLGYSIAESKKFFTVIPPTWRLDVKIEEDVISDFVRIYQYDNLLSYPLSYSQTFYSSNNKDNFLKRLKYVLVDKGYNEIINYSFVDPKFQVLINPNEKFLLLENPISSDMSCMRNSLLSGLINTFLYHKNRQYEEIRLFESGICFFPDNIHKLGVRQELFFSGIIGSINYKSYWGKNRRKLDFYDIKGDIESLFDSIGYIDNINFLKTTVSSLHPQKSLEIVMHNKKVGFFGSLHPILLKKFNLNYSVFVFELFWDNLFFKDINFLKKISDLPYSKRDISIIVDIFIRASDIISIFKENFSDKLVEVKVFDVYYGNGIPSKKKSISFTLIFQGINNTLTDKEIDYMLYRYIKILKLRFGACLRNEI